MLWWWLRTGRRMIRERSGIYVAVEGLDGSGKSTLVNALQRRLEESGMAFQMLCPTRGGKSDTLLERMHRDLGFVQNSRLLRAFLYAERSARATRAVGWMAPLILGDRSVITSYATRWRLWRSSAAATVRFVDCLEPYIPAPDHVFYLHVPWLELRRRLIGRGLPLSIDETETRAEEMRRAYEEIMSTSLVRRLTGTVWHQLNAAVPPEQLAAVAWRKLTTLVEEHG